MVCTMHGYVMHYDSSSILGNVGWSVGPSVVTSSRSVKCFKSSCIDQKLMLYALWYALCIVCMVIINIMIVALCLAMSVSRSGGSYEFQGV